MRSAMRSRVPYISKAEAERRRWVDLADAIGHVKAVDDCDHRQALQSIKAAIEDGNSLAVGGSSAAAPFQRGANWLGAASIRHAPG